MSALSHEPKLSCRIGYQLLTASLSFLAIVVLGCGRPPRRLALLTPTTGVMIWDAVHTGAVREGHACGLKVHYDGPPREDDLRTQLSEFQRYSTLHYGAIAIAPIQVQAFRNPVERVSEAGLPVIVIGEDLGIRNRNIAYVLTDEHMAGRLAARKLIGVLHGEGRVAIMGLDVGRPSSIEREQAFEQELSSRSNRIPIVDIRNGTSNLFQEQQIADDLLNQSTKINAIVALNATATRGAFYALKARHKERQVHLIGFDQDLITPLIDHEIDAVIGVRAFDIGQTIARLTCDRLEGKKWKRTYILSPIEIDPGNYASPEIQQQLDREWWRDE